MLFSDMELPKLKGSTNKGNNKNLYSYHKNISLLILFFLVALFLFLLLGYYSLIKDRDEIVKVNRSDIKSMSVLSYNENDNIMKLELESYFEQKYCFVKNESEDSEYQEIVDNKCVLNVPIEEQTIYFVDEEGTISNELVLKDFVLDVKLKEKYYIPIGTEISLENVIEKYGDPIVTYMTYDNNLSVHTNKVVGTSVGRSTLLILANGYKIREIEIVVTDVITSLPKNFDDKKSFLKCKQFSEEEAKLLDEILDYRIKEAGEGTRAGAVASARFLTLEFPYRISYYWENGRLNNTGRHYVDGEGRYYHKGLYLDQSKVENMEASLLGPAMWGCPIVSYEDDPPNFTPGRKYPNGLDCSGFVSWSLLNGGSDVGDIGSYQLPNVGKSVDLTSSLIKSGEIKVGDLFSLSGHISILIGEDSNNYYVAESLNNYKGVVVKKYSKKTIMNTFKVVVLMDEVYNGDGNLTDMWY